MAAYVSSFVFCDSIQTQITPGGPQYQIVRPLQVLSPIAIPGNYSFSISCNIAGFEKDREHSISIAICAPNGEECARPVDDVKFNFGSELVNGDNDQIPGLSLNIDLRNMVLWNPGVYTAKVVLDGKIIGEYRIEAAAARG